MPTVADSMQRESKVKRSDLALRHPMLTFSLDLPTVRLQDLIPILAEEGMNCSGVVM
jgi:hypothetical protein